ncbi:MAG: heparinase II/III family protein, partial [Bacteroidales bacterium]|nr:heparinase II/III family protein [Bacteroidales bacterium]
GNDIFDIIWPQPELEPTPPESPSIHFRTIDWWVMRSDFKSPEKVLVAGKAGMNDDPHHGHLDIGHFVVHWQNEYFIRDLGSRGYDEKYFDDMRWDYPHASSIGHNVVFVNGERQISGKMRKQPWNYDVGGDVEEFRTSDKMDYVRMNPAKAYPNKELKGWKRHILLEKPGITVVVDEIEAEPGSAIEVRFHPGVDFKVQDDLAMLEGQHGKMALIPLAKEAFKIQPGRHACQYINATQPFFWEGYFDTELRSKESRTIVATLIIPVENSAEADQIAGTKALTLDGAGNVSVSFSRKGKEYSFNFENQKDGIVLKSARLL